MADISKAEWQGLCDSVQELSKTVGALGYKVGSVADGVVKIEEFKGKVEPHMWFLNSAKAVLFTVAVFALGSIAYAIHSHGEMTSEVRHRAADAVRIEKLIGTESTRLEKSRADDTGRLEKLVASEAAKLERAQAADVTRLERQQASDTARLEKSIDKLSAAINKTVSQTNGTYGGSYYHDHVGKFVRGTSDSVTLSSQQYGIKVDSTYPLASGVRVLVKGVPANMADLKPGVNIRVVHREGYPVQIVETVEDEELKMREPAIMPPPAPK